MNDLKPLHEDNRVEVPRRVWNQVEGKLNNARQNRKLFRLKMFTGIAACFIVACALSIFTLGFDRPKSQLFSSNESYKSMVFENLEETNSQLYDYSQVNTLKSTLIKLEPSFAKRRK